MLVDGISKIKGYALVAQEEIRKESGKNQIEFKILHYCIFFIIILPLSNLTGQGDYGKKTEQNEVSGIKKGENYGQKY